MKQPAYPGLPEPSPELLKQCLDLLFEKERLSYMGAFTQGLIHNMNGPMQNMSMLVELVLAGQDRIDQFVRTHVTDLENWQQILEKQRQRLQQMYEQISLVVQMLRDFMQLNEIECNDTEVDVNLVISKLMHAFRSDLFFKHHVAVELRLADNLPLIRVLPRHLIPALVHLFQNAVIAMRAAPEKRLVIETRQAGDNIQLCFKDTGCGFTPEQLDRCFELFYSAWSTATSRTDKLEKHFGYGLFAVRSLLDRYGIRVTLERHDGETVAMLKIPMKPALNENTGDRRQQTE